MDYFWTQYYPKISSTLPLLVPFQRLKAPCSRGTAACTAAVQTLRFALVMFTESPDEKAFEGHLAGFYTYPVAIPTYTYDALNQRIAKTVGTQTVGTQTTRFVYDRGHVYLEFSGTSTTPSTRYLYGPMVDQVLAQESNGQTTWMLTDHLGSVRDLVNDSGTVVNHFTYDSFGQVVGSMAGATADTRYKFTGREYDSETGLYYYRARYFDAGVGRFIGQDPIGFQAGDSNLYRYVGNSPVDATDPSGEVKVELVFNPIIPDIVNPFPRITIGNSSMRQGVTHAFIRVTDDAPFQQCIKKNIFSTCPPQYVYRGGPENEFGSPEQRKNGFGRLVTKSDLYQKARVDWKDPSEQSRIILVNKPFESAEPYKESLKQTLTQIHQLKLNYIIDGPNSNSVAYQCLINLKRQGLISFIPDLSFTNYPPGWGRELTR
ncbi:RHS repeat-associated core domain-containing protein [Phormidium sp. FACHB-592]|uniref:RHS repeat-associated core domain-containing protein n=1 Tax=Stenomitos frigidus AS-A4 TaxID=2933935 RepID=A0ABV0KSN2_9CYAN|nr:RHS repeat-associated core domain-containing protein [Phormidium sp. FACHB-592]MBD2077245.1 RHS repeat-associated core domain-containing protein [Phormidium sp. FACHB-592]